MKPLQFSAVLACVFLTACSGSSSSKNNKQVTISETIPFVLNESETVSVTSASVDLYRSAGNSCNNPTDEQYLGVSTTLSQKTLLCVEYTVILESTRDYLIRLAVDYPGDTYDTDYDYSGTQTTTNPTGTSTRIDASGPIYASPELMGELPQSITVSLGIDDIEGNTIELRTASLQINGELPSTADTSPEGTEFLVQYSDSGVAVLTRYFGLPKDNNYCVDHVRTEVDAVTGDISGERVLTRAMIVTDDGNHHSAFAFLGEDIPAGTYQARVYEATTDGARCFVNDAELAPMIEYEIQN